MEMEKPVGGVDLVDENGVRMRNWGLHMLNWDVCGYTGGYVKWAV